MSCKKFQYRKTSTQWLWGDWEGLQGQKLKRLLLEKMASSEAGQRKFWSLVEIKGETECWPWQGSVTPRNYGIFSMRPTPEKRIYFRATRVAYTLTHGPFSFSLQACHTCDNPICVNPRHLWVGTSPDNTRDRDAKQRQARGETHGMAILEEKQVREIRKIRVSQKATYKELAGRFRVSFYTIQDVLSRKSWKHI
jgi:hypothetical protein